jgi:hypothetical protein
LTRGLENDSNKYLLYLVSCLGFPAVVVVAPTDTEAGQEEGEQEQHRAGHCYVEPGAGQVTAAHRDEPAYGGYGRHKHWLRAQPAVAGRLHAGQLTADVAHSHGQAVELVALQDGYLRIEEDRTRIFSKSDKERRHVIVIE